MAALLLGAAAWGHAAAAPVAPARVQLATWEAGQSLLDGGAATAAGAHYLSLLADGYVLPHVEGALEAANRLCREDSALAALAGRLRGDDARLHLEAARQRAAERHGAAAAAWARLAARASARGDTAGAAIAWLACARARLRAEEPDSARTACARVAVLRLSAAAGGRLRADARTLAAGIAYLAGGHAEADSLYRLALDEAQARGWRQIACDALNGLGAVKSRQRRFAESLAFYARAVDMATALGDSGRAAMCLANLAYQETEARDVAAARGHLARAHKIALACGRPSLLGAVQTGLGAAADAEGRRDAAAEHFRQACDVLVAGGHERGELAARQRLAYVLLQTGEYAQAVSHYERCRLICERLRTPHIRNWVEGGLALACHYLGDLDRAAAAYRRALALNEELGDRMSAAWCLNSLGQLAALQGDYRRALVDHHRALETCAAIDDGAGEARTRVSIAWVHLQLGDLESARDEGERALTLAEAARSEEIAREAMGALQAVYAAAGNPALAELHARRALTIARRWRDKVAMIDALDDLAALHLAQGRRADARRLLADASALLADDGEWPARARTLLLRSRAHGEPDSASALAARALALAREGGLSELEWQCLADLGGLALARGDTAAAERLLTESVTASESLRRRVGVDELRRHLPAPAAAPYESLIALQARRGGRGAPMALATADRARAGVLADRLREALARGGEGPSPESARRERDLVSRLAHVQARLQDGGLDTLTRRDLGQRARDLEREHGLLGLRLAASGAPHARELYAAPESPDSLLAALRPGERLLYYVLGAEGSWLFSATRDAVCAHALPPRDEIETRVDLYLRLRLRGDAPPPVPTMAARGLHEGLVAPAAAELRPGETLVVVPDGLLHRLPFGVLRSADGPLGEGHAVFVAPSLGTLRALRARGAARQEMVDPSPLPLLAVGCEGDRKRGAAARGRVHPFTGAPLPRLHHAEREAAMVADLFPGARLLRDADATEGSGLRALLASAQVVHFAAHGHADDADPRRSYLVLNPPAVAPDAGGADDGLLQWHEAVSLPLRATLVTLASCRSAGGELARGEGVTGLTQAFLHAGADCVLAAQADVPDAAARRLLLAFYRAWRGGLPAAAALQSAQRAALARQDADGWQATGAEFVLVGDGSVMAPGARPARRPPAVATALALTAATAATAVVIAVRRR
ncbi:CHAT domain-containing protein, partial [bacterium]|nr:CHAT domain-containing protein [bacterium]